MCKKTSLVTILCVAVAILFSTKADANHVGASQLLIDIDHFDGPGDKKKDKTNKYKKSGGLFKFNKRVSSSKGRSSRLFSSDNGSNNRLSGSGFRLRKGSSYKSNQRPKAKPYRLRKGNSYKKKWVRKNRERRYYRHDRTGRRGNSFRY